MLISLLLCHAVIGGNALQPKNLLGTWAGEIEIHAPGGNVEHGKAILWLREKNGHVSGCIGESVEKQTPIEDAVINGNELKFSSPVRDSVAAFDLHETGGNLTGAGKMGAVSFELDLKAAPRTHTLYEQIATLDSALFDAVNARDLATCERMFTKDLEFYHDRDGVTNYAQNVDSFRRQFALPERIRRELDDSTLEVYPIKDFGAIESGVHYFYTSYPGQKEQLTATAKFVHVWQHKNGKWQISRVVSYDHH